MKHIGLFAGGGGFELAADQMGWETVAYSEIDLFCLQILKYYFPNADSLGDITKLTDQQLKKYANEIDIITGGFPCQPFSVSGLQKGTDDPRHLWPAMLRTIRIIQPAWVVGENVRGLTTWSNGLVFEQVQADLEAAGYEVQAFLLPAASVGAPHERYRIFFVAYSGLYGHRRKCRSEQTRRKAKKGKGKRLQRQRFRHDNRGNGAAAITSNTTINRFQRRCNNGKLYSARTQRKKRSADLGSVPATNWTNFPTQPPLCTGNDGFPAGLDFTPLYKAFTYPGWRRRSLALAGNAVVPQLIKKIYRAIDQYDKIKF